MRILPYADDAVYDEHGNMIDQDGEIVGYGGDSIILPSFEETDFMQFWD